MITITQRIGKIHQAIFLSLLSFLLLLLFPLSAQGTEANAETSTNLELEEETSFFSIGNTWRYTLMHTVTLYNNSSRLAYNITVEVPLQDEYLPAYNGKIGEQLNPYPDEIITTEDGHRIAVYHIKGIPGNSTLTLTQKYAMEIMSASYAVDYSSLKAYSDSEKTVLSDYLAPEPGIEANDEAILSFARTAVGSESNVYAKARAIFAAVNLKLTYSVAEASQNALDVLNRGTANCEGYVNLYLAALRSIGIPAREVSGYLYTPTQQTTASTENQGDVPLNEMRHVWVEFYLPGTGWVMADPTFTYSFNINGTTQKFVDWSYFANVAGTRRYIFLNFGDKENTINYTATGGNLQVSFNASLIMGSQYVPFNDLEGHWAKDAATYCTEKGYFNGYSISEFAPDMEMSRAMFVTVLGRLYQTYGGKLTPYTADLSQFRDVDPEKYYSEALGWALDEGLVEGYGGDRFGVDDPITREQMAKILQAFLQLLQKEDIAPRLEKSGNYVFTDNYVISDWAKNSVGFCVANQILEGSNDGAFHPQDSATRAQVATIIQRIDALLAE